MTFHIFSNTRQIILLTAFISFLAGLNAGAAALTPSLTEHPLVLRASGGRLAPGLTDFLARRDGGTVRIWVFYTDKGVFSEADYDRVAATVDLSDRQKARRSRTGNENVLFADLPVVSEYNRQIEQLGGRLRRTSRWLNAASFAVSRSALAQLEKLPFVYSIRPVAVYTRPLETIENIPVPDALNAQETINYGGSIAQLTQIGVPAAHRRGYDGAGVILAIFDTGYRKSHQTFAAHFAEGRVLAEYDFINNDDNTANEEGDDWNQWNHGTSCWSIAAGRTDGRLYGPAYAAQYLLAKTELTNEEIQIEEDNWVAALEWADSFGVDVITSSLGYIHDWYTYEDMDGATAVTTIAANTAAGLGIVICNAIGNEGPALGTLIAPSDAHNILAVGAVDAFGNIAGFSSRGPTYDGRTKPEVCARGVLTYLASASTDLSYASGYGTSFATPLVAGAACLLVQAYPSLPPSVIRLSLMETGCHADAPNNIYGWGIIDVEAALDWSVGIAADTACGEVPLAVQFEGLSNLTVSSWLWNFGDGSISDIQNPSHTFTEPGRYDVTLTVETEYGALVSRRHGYIMALADTLIFEPGWAVAGEQIFVSFDLVNSQPLDKINVPFNIEGELELKLDSAILGERTSGLAQMSWPIYDPTNHRYEVELVAGTVSGYSPLAAGRGEILRLFLTPGELERGGLVSTLDTLNDTRTLRVMTGDVSYRPQSIAAELKAKYVRVRQGDANGNGRVDIEDAVLMVNHLFSAGNQPVPVQAGDVNGDGQVDFSDVADLIDYMFLGGQPPRTP